MKKDKYLTWEEFMERDEIWEQVYPAPFIFNFKEYEYALKRERERRNKNERINTKTRRPNT